MTRKFQYQSRILLTVDDSLYHQIIHIIECRWMISENNANSQEKAIMRSSQLPIFESIRRLQTISDRSTCLKIVHTARASIFRHVSLNDTNCRLRLLQWIDDFECLSMAFSWDLQIFSWFIQWHWIVWLLFCGAYCWLILRACDLCDLLLRATR
jgi:hypothetical protein